jgi:hypothetical protein
MSLRRMLPFLLLNIIVSAAVVLGILALWGQPRGCNCEPVALSALSEGVDPTVAAVDALLGQPATATPVAVVDEGGSDSAETDDCDVSHTVAAGESLGFIAEQYDVSMDDIVAATDGLDDPNFLFVGQVLDIPVCGVAPTEAPTVTPVPTLAVVTGGDGTQIEIADILNVGDLSVEQVLIINPGSDAINLEGWSLADSSELVYTFSGVTVFGEGAGVIVHSGQGDDNVPDLFWRLSTPAWQSGETATLRDASGNIQATFVIP